MKLLTRNPLSMHNSKLDQNGTLRGLLSFYWPILLEGFDRKSRENLQKMLFKGSSNRMAKVKKLLFG